MAFWDNLGKKAQDVAYVATETTQKVVAKVGETASVVADRAKIEYAILAEKHSMEGNYRALGEWYVAEVGEDVPEAVADIVAAVRASKVKIAELEASRPCKEKCGKSTCPTCGAQVSTRFCPDCGTEME